MRLGVHMPMKGGFEANVRRVAAIGCRSIQIFPGNPTGWRMGKMTDEEIEKRADLLDQYEIFPLVVHSAYLINLATNKEEFLLKSKKLLAETMERAHLYRSPFVILHTGNHGGEGVEKGTAQIIASIEEGLAKWPPSVKLVLENTAGSGTAIGSKIEEQAAILQSFPAERVGFCFDTAHGFAAGYDLSRPAGVKETMQLLDKKIGLDRMCVLHVNDTKVKPGSRVDRHAHIGEGNIGLEGFRALLNYGWPDDMPVILETPENGTTWDKTNMEKLASLID